MIKIQLQEEHCFIAKENRYFKNEWGLAEYLDTGALKEKVRNILLQRYGTVSSGV